MEWHAKSLKSPLQNLFFAPKIPVGQRWRRSSDSMSRDYWSGILPENLKIYNLCSFFLPLGFGRVWWFWVTCWDTQLPKGKTHFFRQRNPRSSQDSSATIASPTAFVTTRCQGEISGSKSTGRKVVSKQRWTFKIRIFLPPCGFITIQNRDDVWNHLENGPQHKSKGYLSLFQAWFVGRRVKNCPITIKQNQGNQWIYDNFSCVSTIFQAPSVSGQSFRETFQNSWMIGL